MPITFNLTAWQKKQAAILYHYASFDYLKGLQQRFNELMAFIDPTLDLAEQQNRDQFLVSTRWGTRDTSENWGNNAWPFLKSFQKSIAKDIAKRAFDIYSITDANNCGRGLMEYSMAWATPAEEQQFEAMFDALYKYAGKIDDTMDKFSGAGRWDDFCLSVEWRDNQYQFPRLPKFQVRTDVEGESGKIPPRTGVYVSQDDPDGSLQFAWTGDKQGKLVECATFNNLGLEALRVIGRDDLWLNDNKMLTFVLAHKNDPLISQNPFFREAPDASIAPSVIALGGFTSRPCKWYFVEKIEGEYEDIDNTPVAISSQIRASAGTPCPKEGVWQALDVSHPAERFYAAGASLDNLGSAYGLTVWLWLRDH
jgi:hypothetical protein